MISINLLADKPFISQPQRFAQVLSQNKLISLMIIISFLLHATALLRLGDLGPKSTENTLNRSLVISLSRITPDAPPETEQKQQTLARAEPTQSLPELINKTPHPSRKVINEQSSQVNTETQPQQTQTLRQTAQNQVQTNQSDPALLDKTRNEYIKILAAHIDKHKFYPRSARRRHIDGQVKVSFDLLNNGQILNLHTFSGHPVLQKATMDSIRSALPMPPRPESLLALNTMKIEYSMQYALK